MSFNAFRLTLLRPVIGLLAIAAGGAGAEPTEPAPSAIRFDQVGFARDGLKRFVIASAAAAPIDWRLERSDGTAVATGRSVPFGLNAGSGERVHRVDIARALPVGTYRLRVGDLVSRPITVAAHPFRPLFRDAMSFFYQQRSGVPIAAALVQRPDLARAAGHPREIVGCFDGIDRHGDRWPACGYRPNVTGGWYDAGDQGKYVVNGGLSVWTLLNAYERAARRGGSPLMADGALALPERDNGVPDILDEARVEIGFLLSMQIPDGARAAVARGDAITMIDARGLVHHKVADVRWTPLPTAPADDREPRALYPPSTAATLNLAAVAAQCARVWRTIDPRFARTCLNAAARAWAAAAREPALFAADCFDGSGGYGDDRLEDERFWAAAELYATTGEAVYRAALERSPILRATGPAAALSWNSVAAAGTITLLTVPNKLASALTDQRRALLAAADASVADVARQGYAIPYGPARYPWGSNGDMLNAAVVLGTAFDLTGRAAYRQATIDALDYVLGRNPLDRSYVTGYGARPMRHPHHRFWTNQADPRYPAPPPGVLSGGPNDASMTDDVARRMKGRCHPQTCWTDDYRAFTQNEVAINWNAPLVWVAGFLDATRGS